MAEAIASLISDSESSLVGMGPVVIYAPRGRHRQRFPESCVTCHASEAEARAAARPEAGHFAAVASGPSRSSEGFRLYYVVRWLE
jgi:hypothetical protein